MSQPPRKSTRAEKPGPQAPHDQPIDIGLTDTQRKNIAKSLDRVLGMPSPCI